MYKDDKINILTYERPPKSWEKIEDENEKAILSLVNPLFYGDINYKTNCVNCVVAYEFRQRGFDVEARPLNECKLSKITERIWNNIDIFDADEIDELLEKIDITVDARYFLGITYKKDQGHAIVLEVKNNKVILIDPQIGVYINIKTLKGRKFHYKCWRIDNKEFTDNGYNACRRRRVKS